MDNIHTPFLIQYVHQLFIERDQGGQVGHKLAGSDPQALLHVPLKMDLFHDVPQHRRQADRPGAPSVWNPV